MNRKWLKREIEKGIQTTVDNAVNDLRYESKFENPVKYKKKKFIKRNNFYQAKIFLKEKLFYSWRSIFLRFLRT